MLNGKSNCHIFPIRKIVLGNKKDQDFNNSKTLTDLKNVVSGRF